MKILKTNIDKPIITREVIAKIGEAVYHSPEVKSVEIEVEFKDGTTINLSRDETEDRFQKHMDDFDKE
jgi:hypothetical protein